MNIISIKSLLICLFLVGMFASCGGKKEDTTQTTDSTTVETAVTETVEEVVETVKEESGVRYQTRGQFRSVSSVEINGYYMASFDVEEIPSYMPATNSNISLTKEQAEKVKKGDKVSCELVVGEYPAPKLMDKIEILPEDTELKLMERKE